MTPFPAHDLAPLVNRLHRTDALHFVRGLPAHSIDMLFSDPPYSSGGLHASDRARTTMQKYIGGNTKAVYEDFGSDNMDQRSWSFWCHAWLSEAYRALKPGGLVVCFIDWRQLPALTDIVQAAGFIHRGIAVWDKTPRRARPRRGGFRQQAEFIVWASKGAMPGRDVCLPGVFPCALALPKKHLTEKPLELAREVVRLVPDGGVVCDPFAGSGTFLVAAKEAGLQWLGCEANDVYYDLASDRLRNTDAPLRLAA
ncbi:Modification methylase DpnIIB [Paraburkholderia aspalathi]|uniref:DNA-methyltransferase n=1 Tax=Paraburkholderia aspalathi TaxID=1324617 RepID=UPI001909ED68|nr:site-specific DNA-methyltransferase [Paraburkholderia aspalathi]MBK3842959.1 site-specific DNA-methyltransferase [Paraburkholderia aspalathi]CAE6841722.1 Modification methylase DpnIIB [Paraburkholderia aspalathi]